MSLPLINVFELPYEAWKTRDLAQEEIKQHFEETRQFNTCINESLEARIETHVDAGRYILIEGEDNGLENHISNHLRGSTDFNQILSRMPFPIPDSIQEYKERYPEYDSDQVCADIVNSGEALKEGQYLFYGGLCTAKEGVEIITEKPLSTSFCPQVALRNAEWRGKAHDSGEVHLLVLKVTEPKTKAFVFPPEGYLGNEKEVLFNAGAKLTVKRKTLIRTDYTVLKVDKSLREFKRQLSAYLIEIDVS